MSNEKSNRGTALIIVLLLLSVFGCFFFWNKYKNSKVEIVELKATKTALLNDTVMYYQAKNGQLVAEVEKVTLEKKELDLYSTKIRADLKNMKIKLRDAEMYISTQTTTNVKPPDIPLRDTIFIEKEKPVFGKSFAWSDEWGGMGGIIYNDSVKQPYYYSKDSITAVGTKIYKYKFLGLRFKVIGATLKITNANPNSTVSAPKYVKLE
ncbi:MAG: hypothetical protein M0R37_13035 [Bacteroidales bacterium]|nr:hypothetical protein [Bacteroidales bacterium]